MLSATTTGGGRDAVGLPGFASDPQRSLSRIGKWTPASQDFVSSEAGLDSQRAVRLLQRPAESSGRRPLHGTLRLSPLVIEGLGENDRSATGYRPRHEFEEVADALFAHPDESVRGWEGAVDAQSRIVDLVKRAIAAAPSAGNVAIVSRGGVGTLCLPYQGCTT